MGLEYPNREFWSGKKVFITGHTGFKGSWMCILLHELGAEITGYALEPDTEPSLFKLCGIDSLVHSVIGDIRDLEKLKNSLIESQASIVIHMAAQPLVRRSFKEPVYTFDTNIMGTVNILEAIRDSGTVKSTVIVTTDKCYENLEKEEPYDENDRLGGYDPYSASKAAAELITASYRQSFFSLNSDIKVATARAGNVIGGGDWAEDRLIPDIIRSIESGTNVEIRYPKAIRPWQHVLEPLSGYLLLAEQLYDTDSQHDTSWNFGPELSDARDVSWITERLVSMIGANTQIIHQTGSNLHETNLLRLSIDKAMNELGWKPRWNVERAIDSISEFHKDYINDKDLLDCIRKQIGSYLEEVNV